MANLLQAEGLKEQMIGKLRASVTSNRVRSLLLVIIINLLIKEKVWNEFSMEYNNSDTEEVKGKLYLSICLKYLNAISLKEDLDEKYKHRLKTDLNSPPTSQPTEQMQLSSTPNNSSPVNPLFSSGPSLVKEQPKKPLKLIWTDDLVEKIEEKFPGSLSDNEKNNYLMLFHQVISFQLFKHLSKILLLCWSPQVELEVLEGNKKLVDNDIFDVDLKSLFTQYSKTKKLAKSESVDLQITNEYDSMMEIIGSPVDVFRDLNPYTVGSTSESHHLSKKKAKRVDFIFQYKKIKKQDDEPKQSGPVNPLLAKPKTPGDLFVFKTLKCETWTLHSFNSSEDLSDHRALSVLCYPFGLEK